VVRQVLAVFWVLFPAVVSVSGTVVAFLPRGGWTFSRGIVIS